MQCMLPKSACGCTRGRVVKEFNDYGNLAIRTLAVRARSEGMLTGGYKSNVFIYVFYRMASTSVVLDDYGHKR